MKFSLNSAFQLLPHIERLNSSTICTTPWRTQRLIWTRNFLFSTQYQTTWQCKYFYAHFCNPCFSGLYKWHSFYESLSLERHKIFDLSICYIMFSILLSSSMEWTYLYVFNASALSNSANMDEYLQQLDTIVEGIHQNRLKVSILFVVSYVCFFTFIIF